MQSLRKTLLRFLFRRRRSIDRLLDHFYLLAIPNHYCTGSSIVTPEQLSSSSASPPLPFAFGFCFAFVAFAFAPLPLPSAFFSTGLFGRGLPILRRVFKNSCLIELS